MGSQEKKRKQKEHAFFPFQTCSFANVFKRLNASTNTFITFYAYTTSIHTQNEPYVPYLHLHTSMIQSNVYGKSSQSWIGFISQKKKDQNINLGRDRQIDRFYYRLQRSNMTYETKNITFHVICVKVSSKARFPRNLPMNVAIESAHCGCERNSCKIWAWSKLCGKHGRI